MKKINVSSKLSFIISIITSVIFVLYFAYKGFMVYFVQKAMDNTFVGGNTSDITITLWFGISVAMALSMFLFFQFTKIKDLNSQRTIQKGIFVGWAIIAITMIIFIPSYIYFILITIVSSIVSLLSSITLKHKITEDQKNKKETLSEKEIYLLQKLAGVKNPKKYAAAWSKLIDAQVANGNISGSYGLRAHTHGNNNYYSHYAYTGSTNIEAAIEEQKNLMQSSSFKMFTKNIKREVKKTTMMVVMATYNYPNS